MDKPTLLRKLESMLEQIERDCMWGTVEIEFRNGAPVLIRKSATERIESERERLPRDTRYQRTR